MGCKASQLKVSTEYMGPHPDVNWRNSDNPFKLHTSPVKPPFDLLQSWESKGAPPPGWNPPKK